MTKGDEFNIKQNEKMNAFLKEGDQPKTQREKDIWNLKYMRYSIRYGSCYYRAGMIATLDRMIKRLEENS